MAAIPLKVLNGSVQQFGSTETVSADGIEQRSGTTLTIGNGSTTSVTAGGASTATINLTTSASGTVNIATAAGTGTINLGTAGTQVNIPGNLTVSTYGNLAGNVALGDGSGDTITIADHVEATGTLTGSANFGDTETVTIGSKVYTFQTTLTNVDGNIQIGGSLAASLQNLYDAINLTGTPGTQYALAMTINPYVTATTVTATTVVVTAKVPYFGSAGNSIATVAGPNASWGGATLTGGTSDSTTLQSHLTIEGAGAFNLGSVSGYFGEIWLEQVSGAGGNAAVNLNANGASVAGAYAIGTQGGFTSFTPSDNSVAGALSGIDTALGSVSAKTLDQVINASPTPDNDVNIPTAAPIIWRDNAAAVTDLLSLRRTYAGAGEALDIQMGGSTTGHGLSVAMSAGASGMGIDISHAGSGNGIYVNGTGSGRGIVAQMGAASVDVGVGIYMDAGAVGDGLYILQDGGTGSSSGIGIDVSAGTNGSGIWINHAGNGAAIDSFTSADAAAGQFTGSAARTSGTGVLQVTYTSGPNPGHALALFVGDDNTESALRIDRNSGAKVLTINDAEIRHGGTSVATSLVITADTNPTTNGAGVAIDIGAGAGNGTGVGGNVNVTAGDGGGGNASHGGDVIISGGDSAGAGANGGDISIQAGVGPLANGYIRIGTDSAAQPTGIESGNATGYPNWRHSGSFEVDGGSTTTQFRVMEAGVNRLVVSTSGSPTNPMIAITPAAAGADPNKYIGVFSFVDSGATIQQVDTYVAEVSPEGVITAAPGSFCQVRYPSANANDGLWVKETGTGNTGWVKVASTTGQTLQQSYVAGNTIAVTSGEGSVAISNSTDTTTALTVDRSPAGSTSGTAVSVNMNGNTTGYGVEITNSGVAATSAGLVVTMSGAAAGNSAAIGALVTNAGSASNTLYASNDGSGNTVQAVANGSGTALFVDNAGSGNALRVRDGATNVLVIDGSGAVAYTPTSGQNFSVTTAGVGTIAMSAETGAVDIGNSAAGGTGGDVSVIAKASTGTAGDVRIASYLTGAGTSGGVLVQAGSTSLGNPAAGEVLIQASTGITVKRGADTVWSADLQGNVDVTPSSGFDYTLNTSGGGTIYLDVASGNGDITMRTPTASGGIAIAAGDLALTPVDGELKLYSEGETSISTGSTGTIGSALNITAGDAGAPTYAGGDLNLDAGNGDTTGNGGAITITAGLAGATGAGGDVNVSAGNGGATSGNGGNVVITGGTVTSGLPGYTSVVTSRTADGTSATDGYALGLTQAAGTAGIWVGATSPNGTVSGTAGSIYLKTDGTAYINTGATAWTQFSVAGGTTLQTAYDSSTGTPVTVTQTATDGGILFDRGTSTDVYVLGLTDTSTVANPALSVSKVPSGATASAAATITAGANLSGAGLTVTHSGTGTAVIANAASTGNAFEAQDNGTAVFTVTGAGAVSAAPTSGQNFQASVTGAGTSSISTVSGNNSLFSVSGDVFVYSGSGNVALDVVTGTMDLTSSGGAGTGGAISVSATSTSGTAGDITIASKTTGASGTAGNVYLTSHQTAGGTSGGVAISAGHALSAPATGAVDVKADTGKITVNTTTDLTYTGAAGDVEISSIGVSGGQTAGDVLIGSTGVTGGTSGGVAIYAGSSVVAPAAGEITITSTAATTISATNTGSTGSVVTVAAGNAAGASNALGGDLALAAGIGDGSGDGGAVFLDGGQAGATGNGGSVTITGGVGGATSGNGGSVNLVGGTETSGTPGGVYVTSTRAVATEGAALTITQNGTPAGIFVGTVDPSAGGGVVASEGSLFLRDTGSLWIKTGATATDWTQASVAGATNLQTAYDASSPATVTLSATGPITFDNPTTSQDILVLSQATATGSALVVTMGASTTDRGVDISTNASATGAALFLNNAGSGNAIQVQDGGTDVMYIDGNGYVQITPTVTQDVYVAASGNGSAAGAAWFGNEANGTPNAKTVLYAYNDSAVGTDQAGNAFVASYTKNGAIPGGVRIVTATADPTVWTPISGEIEITSTSIIDINAGTNIDVDTTSGNINLTAVSSSGNSFAVSGTGWLDLKNSAASNTTGGGVNLYTDTEGASGVSGAIYIYSTTRDGVNTAGADGVVIASTYLPGGVPTASVNQVDVLAKADIVFDARDMTTPITLNQSGNTDLVGFTATSIVGALNELKAGPGASIVSFTSWSNVNGAPTAGNVVKVTTNDTIANALASDSEQATVGILLNTSSPYQVVTQGIVEGLLSLSSGGTRYFLGTSNGALTSTAPSTTGDLVRRIGWAKNTTDFIVSIGEGYIV